MPCHILSSKYRKFFIFVLIFLIIINCYAVLQSVQYSLHYFKQSNQFLQASTTQISSTYIQRAVLIFYPESQESRYLPEIRWLYRSWLEMMKSESKYWRTDLLIYTGSYSIALQELGCILNQKRQDHLEPPQCRVFLYLRLSNRAINSSLEKNTFYIDVTMKDFYQIDLRRSVLLTDLMKTYGYVDSVNIIAEAYPTFAFYHFILKTDIDVFLTPAFAKYLPITNRTLLVGRGGYSTKFNTRRLRRIARDMNWKYANMTNIGSTWYGPPYVAQRIANLTLDAMNYLSENEFARVEREGKIGVLLWPDWHYGVLSMYGTHLAANHLLISDKVQLKKADELLDQSTTNLDLHDLEKNDRLHLHCWHTDKKFSKFQFKAGKYNSIHPRTLINDTSAQAYAMRMALESQLMTLDELAQRLNETGSEKMQ